MSQDVDSLTAADRERTVFFMRGWVEGYKKAGGPDLEADARAAAERFIDLVHEARSE